MAELTRFGISMDPSLLTRFDHLIESKGYSNRSEAIRDLVRHALIEQQWQQSSDDNVVGTVTLVYDHHVRDLADKLNEHQHRHHQQIISTLHVHLDHEHCLEVIVLKGKAADVQQLANSLIGTKGVKHGQLVSTTSGQGV